MIQICIFILKLIGWIFLGLLGLILGLLLLVLFSAICYRVDGKKEEKLEGNLKITWFFRILSVTAAYRDSLALQVRLFGIRVWKLDSREEDGEEAFAEDDVKEEPAGKDEPEKGSDSKAEAEKLQEKVSALERERQKLLEEKKKLREDETFGSGEKAEAEAEKQSLWKKIKEKFILWIEKLKFAFSEICGKLKQIEEKRQWLIEKRDWLFSMLEDPENHKSARLIFRQIKKIIRHILPRKGNINLVVGREDPYLMGKIVSYASAAYPFVHRFLTFHPVFGQDRLEGEVHIQGRIRLGVILGYVLRLLFNTNIRRKLLCLLRKNKQRAKVEV